MTVEFDVVQHAEFECINLRRRHQTVRGSKKGSDRKDRRRPRDLFGVSCSGGGIRSASFCLGALQALHKRGLTSRIDYLSTVSGGGYVGAGMIAAMSRGEGSFPFSAKSEDPNSGDNARDSQAVRSLRDHSRYMAPRGPIDIVLSAAVILRGLLVNVILILSAVVPLSMMTIYLYPSVHLLDNNFGVQIFNELPFVDDGVFGVAKLLLVICLFYFAGWGVYRSYLEIHQSRKSSSVSEPDSNLTRIGGALLIILVLVLVVELQAPILSYAISWLMVPSSAEESSWYDRVYIALVGTISTATLFRERLVGFIEKGFISDNFVDKMRSILAQLLLYSAAFIVPILIYSIYLTICIWGISIDSTERLAVSYPFAPAFLTSEKFAPIAFGVAVCLLAGMILAFTSTVSRVEDDKFVKGWTETNWVRLLSVAAGCVIVALFIAWVCPIAPSVFQASMPINYLAASAAIVSVAMTFTENANSLHRLYRDRLNTAFALGSGVDSAKPMGLTELRKTAPYLLVNAALNVRQSPSTKPANRHGPQNNDAVKRGRNAEPFLFSSLYVGSDATGYSETSRMLHEEPQLDVATVTAISGAAVSSSMGRFGKGLFAPTLALLNLRLGYWMTNPSSVGTPRNKWRALFRFYLFAEAFGLLRANSERIYVTDGGHIDNIGLYQLLKRECELIIVIDAEADPGMNFGALVDVQRFARIDFGARIDMDWRPVRDASVRRIAAGLPALSSTNSTHRNHFAVGRISYDTDGNKTGIILYVKASVTGDEPDYVLDYERRYKQFPHESTGHQFFSEEQMEAYRALGFHAMHMALTHPDDRLCERTEQQIDQDKVLIEFIERLALPSYSVKGSGEASLTARPK